MRKVVSVLGGAAAVLGLAGLAVAQTVNPGGPWVTPQQTVSLEGFLSYEQLTDQLFGIERRSKGVLEIESVATTAGGREVWLAKIGDPSKPAVMIINQQHGDEPHGAEAALDIVKHLSNASAGARAITDALYVLIVPRMNPDGATIPDRGNGDFDAPPARTSSCLDANGNVIASRLDQGRGVYTDRAVFDRNLFHYDMNRYHWADWAQSEQIRCNPGFGGRHFDPARSPVPEAQGAVDAYARFQPIWVIDVHNQGPSVVVEEEPAQNDAYRLDRRVTGSILWPTNVAVAPAAVALSQQMALIMKKRSMQLGYAEITRYVGGDFPGIARNAYGLMGTTRIEGGETGPLGGSVLVEILGQTEGSINFNLGQKAHGMLRNVARELVTAVLEATADGSLFAEDPAQVDELILANDVNISNPH